MELVGTRSQGDVEHAAACLAKFGGIIAGLNRVLLDRIHTRREQINEDVAPWPSIRVFCVLLGAPFPRTLPGVYTRRPICPTGSLTDAAR